MKERLTIADVAKAFRVPLNTVARSCRVTLGRESEQLRKITPSLLTLEFQDAGRIEGRFELIPKQEDFVPIANWISAACDSQERLRITFEAKNDDQVDRGEGWCIVAGMETNIAVSATVGFNIVGRLEPSSSPLSL
jgi:hypothetical protein